MKIIQKFFIKIIKKTQIKEKLAQNNKRIKTSKLLFKIEINRTFTTIRFRVDIPFTPN